MSGYRTDIAERQCPKCRTVIVALERSDRAPAPTDKSIVCGACGCPLFCDTEGTLRIMTPVRFNALPHSERQALARAQRAIMVRNQIKAAEEMQQHRGPKEAPKHDTKTTFEN